MSDTSDTIRIGDQFIGAGRPCFVIAEAGVNHNGELAVAHELVDVAAQAGADAVKFQTFNPNLVVAEGAAQAAYQQRNQNSDESQRDMLARMTLTPKAFNELQEHCQASGVVFLSTPFDLPSVDVLVSMGVTALKVPSGEITHSALLRHMARQGLPLIVSTGMCTLDEVRTCLTTLYDAGQGALALLHCLSSYPADPAEINLRAMNTMADAFGVPVGFSDHTLGTAVPLAAVALGACIVEKHFTLDRRLPGPDHLASLEPNELADMIRGIREVEASLGDGTKRPMPSERNTREVARRSLWAARDLSVGATLAADDLVALRPATGIPACELDRLVGRRLTHAVARGQMLSPTDLSAD